MRSLLFVVATGWMTVCISAQCTPSVTLVDPTSAPSVNSNGFTFSEVVDAAYEIELNAVGNYAQQRNNQTDTFFDACQAVYEAYQCPRTFGDQGFGQVLPFCVSTCINYAMVCAGYDFFTAKIYCLGGSSSLTDPSVCPSLANTPPLVPITEPGSIVNWFPQFVFYSSSTTPAGSTLAFTVIDLPLTLWLQESADGDLAKAIEKFQKQQISSPVDSLAGALGQPFVPPNAKAHTHEVFDDKSEPALKPDESDAIMKAIVYTGVDCKYFSCLNLIWMIAAGGNLLILIVFVAIYFTKKNYARHVFKPLDLLKKKHLPPSDPKELEDPDLIKQHKTSFGGLISIGAVSGIVTLGIWMFVVFFVLNSITTYGFVPAGTLVGTQEMNLLVNFSFYYTGSQATLANLNAFKLSQKFILAAGVQPSVLDQFAKVNYNFVNPPEARLTSQVYIPVTPTPTASASNGTSSASGSGSAPYYYGSGSAYGGSGSTTNERKRASSSASIVANSVTTFLGPETDTDGSTFLLVWGLIPVTCTYSIIDHLTLTFSVPNPTGLKNATVSFVSSFGTMTWSRGSDGSGIGAGVGETIYADMIQGLLEADTPDVTENVYGVLLNSQTSTMALSNKNDENLLKFVFRPVAPGVLMYISQDPMFLSTTAFSFFITVFSAIFAIAAFLLIILEQCKRLAKGPHDRKSFMQMLSVIFAAAEGKEDEEKEEMEDKRMEALEKEVKKSKEAKADVKKPHEEIQMEPVNEKSNPLNDA